MSTTKPNAYFQKLEPLFSRFRKLKKNSTFAYGVPFFILVIGGSFGLREWTSIRYFLGRNKSMSFDEVEKMGLKKARNVTLEDAYEEIKTIDIDNWENKRGPRPWEEETMKINAPKK